MAGTKGKIIYDESGNEIGRTGGLKAAQTNIQRRGHDFYARIGAMGGSVPCSTRGFGSDSVGADGLTGRERARIYGAKGGAKSRRGPAKRRREEVDEL